MSRRFDFDHNSGQVFTETSIRALKKHASDWIGEFKTPSLYRPVLSPNEHGARSLQDMVRAQVARNMRQMTPDHLREIPWAIAEKLWEDIVAMHGESFHAWRVLAMSHGDRFSLPQYRYYIDIRRPPMLFPDYLKGLNSLSFLVCLRISPKNFDRADLVQIAKLSNLAILDLSDQVETVGSGSSNFDERIMKAWSEQEGGFTHLRAMLFGWQPAISTWIFRYLNKFPALSLVVTTACPNFGQWNRKQWEAQADMMNWEARHAKKSVQLIRTIISEEKFYFGSISSILFDANSCGSRMTQKPVVECLFGNPPQWENVIRDFPKVTQTVWLEKKTDATEALQTTMGHDASKRVRDAEKTPTENRSPPSKRLSPRRVSRAKTLAVSDLLGSFI